MVKKCRKLKAQMAYHGFTQSDIANMIGRSPSYVMEIMTGRTSPRMSEVYKMCLALEIPYEEISQYFPPEDMAVRGAVS